MITREWGGRTAVLVLTIGSIRVRGLVINGDSVEFEYSGGGSAPDINYGFLKDLSEYFGTDNINIENDICVSGCETCDWGSEYGYTFYIKECTKGLDNIREEED